MAWSDRRYLDEPAWGARRPQEGLLWLVGTTVAVQIVQLVLGGTNAIQRGDLQAGIPGAAETWLGVSADGLLNHFRLWQPVTYLFIHGGIRHLFWNMLLLLFAGCHLEGLLGTRKFFVLYLACGAAGALGTFCTGAPDRPIVGASGAIMGLFAVLMVLVPNQPVNAWFFAIRLKWVVLALVTVDVCFAVGDGVILEGPKAAGQWSNVFGASAGFVLSWLWPLALRPRLRRYRERAARRRALAATQRRVQDEKELDRILEKINRDGLAALTPRERGFLKRASSRYQDSHRQ